MSIIAFSWICIPGHVSTRARSAGRYVAACLVWGVLSLVVPSAVNAAGLTVENTDWNKLIEIHDAVQDRDETIVLYSTRPQIDQPHRSERCALNFYLLRLRQGLDASEPIPLAENYCAAGVAEARLLTRGDVLLVAGDAVETWRAGEGMVSQWSLGSVDVLRGHWNEVTASGALVEADPEGGLVFARNYYRKRGDKSSPSGLALGFDPEGKIRWWRELNEPGVLLGIVEAWVTPDGGALLHLVARSMDDGTAIPGTEAPAGTVIISQNRLYRVSAGGEMAAPLVIASFQIMDFSNPVAIPDMTTDPEGYRAFLEGSADRTQADAWAAGDVMARPSPDDAMDVVLGVGSREARFLRVGKRGDVVLDTDLTPIMEEEGLARWVDFSSDTSRILLFGSLSTRQNRLPQGYVSQIELPAGPAVTRLAPLSELGLSEAQEAGEEDLQYLQHNPSQQPQRLTKLGDHPVTISLVWRSRRHAIQIDEIDAQSVVYTETRDERRAAQAKEARRAQRKADREANQQAMHSEMAAAIGVSDDEYAAMSNKERKEAMLRSGNMEAAVAAAMAQAQQAMTNAGVAMPGVPANSTTQSPAGKRAGLGAAETETGATAENTLPVDSNLHGTIEFDHPDGVATTLMILDRRTGKELLRKEYVDGSVYEYVEFSRYQLPLEQLAVIIRDADNEALRELTPRVVE